MEPETVVTTAPCGAGLGAGLHDDGCEPALFQKSCRRETCRAATHDRDVDGLGSHPPDATGRLARSCQPLPSL